MAPIDDLVRAAALAASPTPGAARAALDSLPWLIDAIAADRAAGLFALWGSSTVVDENTGEAVIPEPLFAALHEQAGIEATWPIGNAGLLHTYGYLLSLAPTPYGLKRERWLGTELAGALGLDPAHFLPWVEGPTLLARATEAATALFEAAEFAWYAPVGGRATRTALGAERGGARGLAYAVAPAPGHPPLLVTMFPVADATALRRELDEASARLRWNAA